MYMYMYMYYVYVYMYMYMYMYICICICIYVYVYIYMYICICIHIYMIQWSYQLWIVIVLLDLIPNGLNDNRIVLFVTSNILGLYIVPIGDSDHISVVGITRQIKRLAGNQPRRVESYIISCCIALRIYIYLHMRCWSTWDQAFAKVEFLSFWVLSSLPKTITPFKMDIYEIRWYGLV